VSQWSKATVC